MTAPESAVATELDEGTSEPPVSLDLKAPATSDVAPEPATPVETEQEEGMNEDPEVAAQQNTDGTVTLTVKVPAPPEWSRTLDDAMRRMQDWERASEWYFVSIAEPSHSYGYICVLEKRAITHSMSGSSGLASAVAGFGQSMVRAIDHAISLAQAHDAEHGRKEETPGYVHDPEAW